jgi:hypothetical protein
MMATIINDIIIGTTAANTMRSVSSVGSFIPDGLGATVRVG